MDSAVFYTASPWAGAVCLLKHFAAPAASEEIGDSPHRRPDLEVSEGGGEEDRGGCESGEVPGKAEAGGGGGTAESDAVREREIVGREPSVYCAARQR
ncbi:hypothetical protein C1H46_026154 [Malus baccata]|uniref:Uncharacterized protein n=1 Tax=Malus baccata TaxID=106549 RepID=A0A540LP74_MALBA|nr:hypothetical protein C1H46_026154 [Malus baccata]